jgi:hypothetical protein
VTPRQSAGHGVSDSLLEHDRRPARPGAATQCPGRVSRSVYTQLESIWVKLASVLECHWAAGSCCPPPAAAARASDSDPGPRLTPPRSPGPGSARSHGHSDGRKPAITVTAAGGRRRRDACGVAGCSDCPATPLSLPPSPPLISAQGACSSSLRIKHIKGIVGHAQRWPSLRIKHEKRYRGRMSREHSSRDWERKEGPFFRTIRQKVDDESPSVHFWGGSKRTRTCKDSEANANIAHHGTKELRISALTAETVQ